MNKYFGILILFSITTINAKMTSELQLQLNQAQADEMITCVVELSQEYPYYDIRQTRPAEKIEAFRTIAKESQKNLLKSLSTYASEDIIVCNTFWIMNAIHIKAKPAVVKEITRRRDVKRIYHNARVYVDPDTRFDITQIKQGIEWGISQIEADKCWDEGATGKNVLIGIIDTGVDFKHPALKGKWSGHWKVAEHLQQTDEPYDDHGHGTHCVGTILGGDGRGAFEYDIGVAPDAKYAVAKNLNSEGSGVYANTIKMVEYMAEIKEQDDIVAISCSWGNRTGGDDMYEACFKTVVAVGIVPVISIGNKGASGTPGSVGSPGDYPFVIGIGATDKNDKRSNFSSLGPTIETGMWADKQHWIRNDWEYIKPNIAAPGSNINSAKSGGGYTKMNGTSMAAPHVCGVIALLFQKNKNLTVKQVYSILVDNTDQPSGATYPNNNLGWGRVNAFKALKATPSMNQPWITVTKNVIGNLAPGKKADMEIEIKNTGGVDAKSIQVNCISRSNFITIENNIFQPGDLKPDASADNKNSPFKLTAHKLTPQGLQATISLIMSAKGPQDSLDFLDTIDFPITIGNAPAPIVIFNEDFEYANADSFSIMWNASGNWQHSSAESHSPSHSGYSGAVQDGALSLTLNKGIDLSKYDNVTLRYWEKYMVDKPLLVKTLIEISSDNGTNWLGVGTAHENNSWNQKELGFSPNQSNNVKIRFTINARPFIIKKADWYIDDLEIVVPMDNLPPQFDNTTILKDGSNPGPFEVKSTITDASEVKEAFLHYKTDQGSWEKRKMDAQGNEVYQSEIPKQPNNTRVHYYLEATDQWTLSGQSNTGTFPIGASENGGYITFSIGQTALNKVPKPVQFSLVKKPTRKGQWTIFLTIPTKMNIHLTLYNLQGRKIDAWSQVTPAGQHTVHWVGSKIKGLAYGMFFLKFEAAPVKSGTMEKYQHIERILLCN